MNLILVLKESIVTADWLEYLWPKEKVKFLIDLMKRTMLISDWKFGEFANDEAYLVPSLIERESLQIIKETREKLVQFVKEEEDIEDEIERLKAEGFFTDEIPEASNKMMNKLFGFMKKEKKPKRNKKEAGGILDLNDGVDFKKKLEEKYKKDIIPQEKEEGKEKQEGKEEEEESKIEEKLEEVKLPEGYYSETDEVKRIVFDFSDSFLPNGVFQRLLCLLILKCTKEKQTSIKPILYKSSAIIEMGNGQRFKICKCENQILCTVEKDFLVSYKVLQSMMEKLKSDVMGKGLDWQVYLETVYEEKQEKGFLHTFISFAKVRSLKLKPWFNDELIDTDIVNRTMGVELDAFIADLNFN